MAGTVVPPADDPAAAIAWADEEAVSQILDNLVDNALKYSPPEGKIRVGWWEENGQVCLEVADNGIGIPEQDLPRIFERFYRVDRAALARAGRHGPGLVDREAFGAGDAWQRRGTQPRRLGDELRHSPAAGGC